MPPTVASKSPIAVELKAGETYYWCACGKSASQPFCDGSHKGSGMTPRAFTVDADKKAYLCACKRTGKAPFCDGTHKTL